MFKSRKRYVTRRVNEKISILIQRFLWYLIDEEVWNVMFKSKERYVTKQVVAEIPVSIQRFLWYLVDEEVRKDKDLNYLQILEVKPVQGGQIVIHRQE